MGTSTIIKEVRSALEHEPRVELHNHPLKISFEPDDSLILEGELPGIAAKKLALRHTAAVSGVLAIIDRLRVTPSRPMGDGEIRDHARNALMEEPALD